MTEVNERPMQRAEGHCEGAGRCYMSEVHSMKPKKYTDKTLEVYVAHFATVVALHDNQHLLFERTKSGLRAKSMKA